jgi:hypothetical protein
MLALAMAKESGNGQLLSDLGRAAECTDGRPLLAVDPSELVQWK